MGVLYFKAELLDDVVLSQRTATVGDHKSLDYIPGSAFLGVFAARFYETVGTAAWDIFHSSKVRFLNAYPLVAGKRSIPMPLAFHSEKVPRPGREDSILNFVYPEVKENEEESIQYRQNRSGYVHFQQDKKISVITPLKTSRMRTAIDGTTGTAAKSQLYRYESLNAGQIFIGKIEWDESIADSITPLVTLFEQGTVVHMGRSKTASYGRVRISKEGADVFYSAITEDSLTETSFSVLAISDLNLRNLVTGTPELKLTPDFLGLGEHWHLDRTKSFSRPSYVYQYNAHRREIELQKTLISKGSVFTFKSDKEITAEEKEKILSAIAKGIGESKEKGFGEIALFNIGKDFIKVGTDNVPVRDQKILESKLSDHDRAWLSWIAAEVLNPAIENKVKNAISEFTHLCQDIKVFWAFDDDFIFWPKSTQWARIREKAKQCNTRQELQEDLFGGDNPVIKKQKVTYTERNKDQKISNSDPEWNYESAPKDSEYEGKTLRKWLMDFIADEELNDREIKVALQKLVTRCKDKINDKNWLSGGVR